MQELPELHQRLIHSLVETVRVRYPEMTTDFEVWHNPENGEHILVNVYVPFYDDDREQEFSAYTATLECDYHEKTGVLISLLPLYEPELTLSTV
jgi:hypothetical protein